VRNAVTVKVPAKVTESTKRLDTFLQLNCTVRRLSFQETAEDVCWHHAKIQNVTPDAHAIYAMIV
jgi:hypothetical protein